MKSLLVLLACLWAAAASPMTLHRDVRMVDPTPWVQVLEDPGGQLSRADMDRPEVASQFRSPSAVGLNFGFTRSTYWVRLALERASDAPGLWLLVVPYALIDEITLHVDDRAPIHTGARLPMSSRAVFHRHFAFPLEPGTQAATVYLRVRSANALKVPLALWQVPSFNRQLQGGLLIQGLYFGGILTLMFYNLSLYLSLRDRRFLNYLLFAAMLGAGMLAGNGFGRQFVWTDSPGFDVIAQTFFMGLAGCFGARFTGDFLRVGDWSPRLSQWLWMGIALNGVCCLALLLAAGLPMPVWLSEAALLVQGLLMVLVVAAAIRAVMAGRPHAKAFLLAWGALCTGGAVAMCHIFGWLPGNVVTAYALQIGSSVEMLLLALILTQTVRAEHAARVKAQAELIETRRASEERLGAAVVERTQALGDALLRAESAAAEQRQLLSMASHEFRTPAAIIKASVDSLQWLRERLPDEVLRRLDNIRAASQRLQGLANEFIDQDRLGMESLQPQLAPLDIRWLARQVVAEYRPTGVIQLAPAPAGSTGAALTIHGDAVLLSIAVRNLVDNAIRHNPPGAPPVLLSVSEGLSGDRWVIRLRVTDFGPGVADDKKSDIFERYVSGQPGAAHSGLGLSIVRRVASLHGGEVRVMDGQPTGAVFELTLPLAALRPATAGSSRRSGISTGSPI